MRMGRAVRPRHLCSCFQHLRQPLLPLSTLKTRPCQKPAEAVESRTHSAALSIYYFLFFLYLHLTAFLRVLLTDFKSWGENNYPHSLPEVRNFQESFRRRSTGQKAPGSHQRSCHLSHCVGVSPKVREHGAGGRVCLRALASNKVHVFLCARV